MFRKALPGFVVMCVCAAMSFVKLTASATDIVLYAVDATNLKGNWLRNADITAAGGQVLVSVDNGWSNTAGPLTSPTHSIDFVLTASAGTPYHVWTRMRAAANSKYNDSMFMQFSDAVNSSGVPLFAIGSTSALTLNLASDSGGGNLNGWGWQDGAYWLSQPSTISFAADGTHTLRIQTREDGVQIDQIVLSPSTFLTAAPGLLANDATIVAKPKVSVLPVPASVPAPWSGQDVGAAGVLGTSSAANGIFNVGGGGADIWGTSDAFRFVSQPVTGDVQIVARVGSIQNTNSYAKAGVMLRETSAPDAAHVLLDVRPNGSLEFMTRSKTGATTTFVAGGTISLPAWLKLTRNGSVAFAAVSTDGSTWTLVGTVPSPVAANALLGVVVTSHDVTQVNTASFDNVAVTALVAPPAAPTSPLPGVTARDLGTSATLSWSASGATSYDLNFGTSTSPPRIASAVGSASYIVRTLAPGTTYYWQVIARNAAGSAMGPLWSFTTAVAAPSVPTLLAPTAGVSGSAVATTLAWSATGATSYDVAFGALPNPPTIARNVAAATFAPTALRNGTTYYWQVTARNAGGAVTGPVWSFTTVVALPALPTAVLPLSGTTGTPLTTTMTWTSTAATSYDVAFGATANPPTVASNLASAAFAPVGLLNGTTYYWQVTARNAGGTIAGPVWSFTTVVAAPGVPTAPLPLSGATGSPLSTMLSWSSSGATSYDVAFGIGTSPSAVPVTVAVPTLTPGTLLQRTTYYWQVTARNAGGSTVGPVWSFTTVAPARVAPVDIVLRAIDASALQGNWVVVAEPTAAGGQAVASVDKGWANTAGPLAAPTDSFEFAFDALSATPYHVWMRLRAAANSKYNDSVFLQFSDALDATGAAVYPIGSNGGLVVNLATDSAASSLNGWGWQDGAYWLTQSATVTFSTDGRHRLRVQTREDGVSIDQVVLSPATYLTLGPGSPTNDNTIIGGTGAPVTPVPTPAPAPPVPTPPVPTPPVPTPPVPTPPVPTPPVPTPLAPAAYNAIFDRNPYAKPALPVLGAAGYSFADPTFGSRMLRVTDGATRPGLIDRSYRVPSNAHLAAWNSNSSAFVLMSNDGTAIPFAFDAATMTASRINPSASGDGGLTLSFYVEPQFSLTNPNVIYGAASGSTNRTISRYDFAAHSYSTVIDLDTLASNLAGTYVGGLMTGGTTSENLMTFFGGPSQDSHYLALWLPIGNAAGLKLLNTVDSTLNGSSTRTILNFHLHSAQIDKSGRYVFLYPTVGDLAAPRSAAQVFLWDTTTDTFTAITSSMKASGHDAAGYGYWINQDCCTSSTWDAAQWQFRSLTSLTQTMDLISPVLATKEVFLADHTTWNNAQPSTLVPVISSTYRYGANSAPWRAWDDEIIAIDTTGSGGMVYRFAHHRSDVGSDADPTRPYFWYEPIANVSPDGRWVLVTSNWEKTLGRDSSEGTFRQDVFLVKLTPF